MEIFFIPHGRKIPSLKSSWEGLSLGNLRSPVPTEVSLILKLPIATGLTRALCGYAFPMENYLLSSN